MKNKSQNKKRVGNVTSETKKQANMPAHSEQRKGTGSIAEEEIYNSFNKEQDPNWKL